MVVLERRQRRMGERRPQWLVRRPGPQREQVASGFVRTSHGSVRPSGSMELPQKQ
jgi:hypothetical protein